MSPTCRVLKGPIWKPGVKRKASPGIGDVGRCRAMSTMSLDISGKSEGVDVDNVEASSSIDDKCAASNAVAEKPRNHLDMRHRLDSTGQCKGKVIDYRVFELLDGLCEKMQDYTLQKVDSNKQEWIKVDTWDNLPMSKQEAKSHSKDLSSYCGRLLEETEDEFEELIKK